MLFRSIVVTSEPTGDRLMQDFGINRARVHPVVPGTDDAPRAKGSGGPGCRILAVGTLVIVYAVYFLAHMTMIQSWVLATQFRFDWNTRQNGYLLFCVGLLSTIVQGGMIGRLIKRFGEERLILMAVGSNVVVQTLYGLAPQGWMMYPILFASILTFTAGPSIQGAVSKTTPAEEQGVTMGALQSISALAGVLGPICGNALLAQVASLPPGDLRLGVNFYFCAALNFIAFLIALRHARRGVSAPMARQASV